MKRISQANAILAELDAAVLIIGIIILLLIILIVYRERRVRRTKQREEDTRLTLGPYDLYSPVDHEKINELITELYQMYFLSYSECGINLEPTKERHDWFVKSFAYPYITGRMDLTILPLDVAIVFRRLHDHYLQGKSKPA